MQSHFEFGDDAKVSTASAQCPVEFRVFAIICANQRSIGGDQREAGNVVARESKQSSELTSPAAQHQAASTGVRNHAGWKYEAMLLRRGVDIAQETSAAKSCAPRSIINLNVAKPR